jgi:N-acetylmuramic acid 6-phosphate etherase
VREGPRLSTLADVVIAIATGPEVLTGSTRLKAGSATKAVFVTRSRPRAMLRLGKAYGNLMVDLRRTSAKLVDPRAPHRDGRRRDRRRDRGSSAGRLLGRGQDRDRGWQRCAAGRSRGRGWSF